MKQGISATGRNPDGTFALSNDFSKGYKEEYADKLVKFFTTSMEKTEYKRRYNGNGDIIYEEPIKMAEGFPTFGTFAMSIGCSVSAISAWAGLTYEGKYKHDRFAIAYQSCKEWAEGMLRSGSLVGKLDSNMAKFVLANDYNMTDKQQQEVKYQIVVPDEVEKESV